jgi:hypothetical protein
MPERAIRAIQKAGSIHLHFWSAYAGEPRRARPDLIGRYGLATGTSAAQPGDCHQPVSCAIWELGIGGRSPVCRRNISSTRPAESSSRSRRSRTKRDDVKSS